MVQFNVRFNDLWTADTLLSELGRRLDVTGHAYELTTESNATAFTTPAEKLAEPLAKALETAIGTRPAFSTAGGTSDARFIQAYCPVVEMGLPGKDHASGG